MPDESRRRILFTCLGLVLLFVLCTVCSLGGYFGYTYYREISEIPVGPPGLSVSPAEGPSGTNATITLTGAIPNAPLDLTINDELVTIGLTDDNGSFTFLNTFVGNVGDGFEIVATIGPNEEQEAVTFFEIVDELGGDLQENVGLRWSFTIDPPSGLSGTSADLGITGAQPNTDVLVEYGSMSHSGVTDGQGDWSERHTFYGDSVETYDLRATVAGETAEATFDITGALNQEYTATTIVVSDTGGHQFFILMLELLDLNASPGSVVIEGDDPWVTVTGEIGDDGSFNASGLGTAAGFSNIAVTFEGTISMDHIEGLYTMGAEGGLPGGEPIVYEVAGTPVGAEAGGDALEQAVAFFDTHNAAQAASDSAALFGLLHPAVLEIYGSQACMTYLDTIVNPAVSFEVLSAVEIGQWDWERDGVTIQVDDAYELQVSVDSGQGISETESHLAVRPDGSLGWFTDCGEPQ